MSRYSITITTEDGYETTYKARNKDEVIRRLSNYITMTIGDNVEVGQ